MKTKALLAAVMLVAASHTLSPAPALAQDYPNRPVTIIAPFPAGSVTDGVARVVAESLRRTLKQNVIVENKPGQEGAIAGRAAAHAEPDGYTILIGGNSTHSAPMSLFKSLAYKPETDFVCIGGLTKIPLLLAVHPDFPASDLQGFIKAARGPGKKLTFGSGATSTRAAGELLKARANFEIVHVPYRGIPAAITDLIGGRIDAVFTDPATVLGMVGEGKVKVLAVTSATRMERLPNVGSIAEQGFPGFEVVPWLALFAPVKTPPEIVARLRAALEAVHADPEIRAFMTRVAVEPFPLKPDQLSAYLGEDIKRWADFVVAAGIEKN
jgi:tripartite-type tricarboxylate transporter receptor subunit TctC